MGLFDKLFNKKAQSDAARVTAFFRSLTGYSPNFTTRQGGVYEMELTVSAIHAFAKHCSKLKPEVSGSAKASLQSILEVAPNPFMDTTKFLYRLATILKVQTTAFIIPLTDPTDRILTGFYPLLPGRTEIVEDTSGTPWLRYTFSNGQTSAIEFSRVGILTTHQYADDFFGTGHDCLAPTLDLLDIQRQGMSEAVQQSAFIRFIGRLQGTLRPEDIKAERDRFSLENLSSDNKSGIILGDQKYAELKQIESKPYLVDAEQMALIKDNVYGYFGSNDAILQNSYDENGWNAFYEGEIEPFALQLSLVLTSMVYTQREIALKNRITFSSNRLQYASNTTKLAVVRDLTDRGLMSNYGACDTFSLPYPTDENGKPLPERWVIRGEYIDVGQLPSHTVGNAKEAANAAALKAAADAASAAE